MNKIFKVIWNKARNCYVVVSELAKSHDNGHVRRSGCYRKAAVLAAFVLTTSLVAMPVWAADGKGNINNNVTIKDNQPDISAMYGSNNLNGENNVVYGTGNTAEKSGAVIVGKNSKGDKDSVVVGNNAQSNAENQIIIGQGIANGSAIGSIIIGNTNNTVDTSQSVLIGNNTKANGSGQGIVVIGNGAIADSNAAGYTDNNGTYIPAGIVLGEYSYSSTRAGKVGYLDDKKGDKPSTAFTDEYWNAVWKATANPMAIGDADTDASGKGGGYNGHGVLTRQITGVAAGTDLTDAVNVAQLQAAIAQFSGGGSGTGGDEVHFYSVNETNSLKGNYDNKGATGTDALAAGVDAKATGNYATAVGNNAQALKDNAVAIGNGALADGVGATVIGQYARAAGDYATAFGGKHYYKDSANKTGEVTLTNEASGIASTAFGEGSKAMGEASLAFGLNTQAGTETAGQQSVAFGEGTKALGGRSLAFGERTLASFTNSVAFGADTQARSNGATAFGSRTRALAQYSTAMGNRTVAAGNYAVAFGTDTIAGVKTDESGALTLINNTKIDSNGNIAYVDGQGKTYAVRDYSVNGGETHDYVVVTGTDGKQYIQDYRGNIHAVTIDDKGVATASTDVAKNVTLMVADPTSSAGYTLVSYDNATAFGQQTKAMNKNATAFGKDSEASGENATALGDGSVAAAANSLAALGGNVSESATNSFAIGKGAEATLADTVALGSGSVTTRSKFNDLTNKAEKAAYGKGNSKGSAWEATDNAIAVGNDSTTTRQITGVAAGSLDTDAVNVAQLRAIDEKHTIVTVGGQPVTADNTPVTGGNLDLKRTTATNGQETYDLSLDKNVTLGEQAETKGGTLTVNNVDKFRNYDKDGHPLPDTTVKEAVKIDGKTVSVVKHDGSAADNNQRQVVLGVDQDAGGYVALYDNTGKKPTYIYNAITPGATYLKDGESYTADNAKEYGRLEYGDYHQGTIQFIATLDDGQKYAGDNYKAAETETKTVDGKTTTAIKKDEQNVLLKKLNERLDIKGGATSNLTENNIGVNVDSTTDVMKVQLAQNIDLTDKGSVMMGNTTIDNGGVTITTKNGDNTNTISLTNNGLDNGGKTITNVANGTNGTDAVNVSQLNAAKTTVTSNDHSVMVTPDNNTADKHTNYDLKIATATLSQEKTGSGDSAVATGKVSVTNPTYTDNNEKTITNDNAYVTGKSVADAINNSGFKLIASASEGDVTGNAETLIHPGDTVTIDAGKNISLTQTKGKISIATKDKLVLGMDGKDGHEGTIGLTGKDGLPGTDGKQGYSTTIIKTEKGQPGADGKNGKPGVDGKDITRIVYTDKDGSNPQTVATLDDGLKFAGDDGSKTVAKKLNETLQIRGDGTYDTDKKTVADDGNIKTSVDNGAVKVSLSDKINLHQDGYLTVGGDKNGEAADGSDPIIIKNFGAGELTVTGTDKDGSTPQSAAGDYVTGLDNKDWNVDNPEYVSGRAATEDQLKKISDAVKDAATTAGKHTVVTVNDKDGHETKATAGNGVFGEYAGTDKDNLLIDAKDDNGQLTYNIKLNDQLTIGQQGEPGVAGKDGKDGKVTVETKGGTTVVIGHDGEPGKDGKDGLFVTGKDGADGKSGVSIIGPNGANGVDGVDGKVGIAGKDGKDAVSIAGKDGVGHIGLTGPKGEKGADGTPGRDGASIDISTDYGTKTLDSTKNVTVDNKEQSSRIIYNDTKGSHEVATMDDGLKFVGNDGKEVTKKLNSTLSLTGGLDKDAVAKASSKNLGVRSNTAGDGLEIVMTDTPDFEKVTIGKGTDTTQKIIIGEQTVTGKKSDSTSADKSQTGSYITGLDNKAWDKDNVVEDRAATEGQLRDIVGSITNQKQGGGFALTSDEKGADKIVKQDLGKAIQIKGDTTYKADGSVEKDGNIKTSIDNGAIKVELNKKVDLTQEGSIKAGNTTINKDGVDTNKVKVGDITITKGGINGGTKQITNIASGIDGKQYTDAGDNNAASIGDVKQLAKNEAKASEAKSGKNITVKDDHTVNLNDNITLGNDPNKQIAINGSNGQVVIGTDDSAMTLGKQENKAGDSNPKEGNFLNGLDNKKWDGEHIQNGRAATEDQLKTVSDKVNSGRVFQGDDGQNVTVGLGDTLKIQGGAKDVSNDNNIGIVKGADDTLNIRLAKDLTGLSSVTTGDTTINNSGLTVKGDDNHKDITIHQGNVNMGGNKIESVAPGKIASDSTDAVNGSQLFATNQTVANLGGAVNKLGTRVNRVGAGAAALAALHPLDFDPDDKWDFAAGYGNYKDASAVAVGAYYRPNEDTMFSVGGSFGSGENMVNAGVSFKVGQGNHVSTSRVAMAKEIKDLRQDVANLNAIVNRQSALIDKLTGTHAGTVPDTGNDLFPDVPANHWAYEYVTKLKQAGILTGYPDGNFDGDRMMTRYEFAAIVYRAIMAGAASNPALSQDGTLDKLAKEFSPEMKHIRVDTIAKDKDGKPTIERVRVIPDAQS